MPKQSKCPEGMNYGDWLRSKNISIGGPTRGRLHADSGTPVNVHNALEDKNRDRYESIVKKQGKEILPEDM